MEVISVQCRYRSHDRNGNSRGRWFAFDHDGRIVGCEQLGSMSPYSRDAVPSIWRGAVVLPAVEVTPRQYREDGALASRVVTP